MTELSRNEYIKEASDYLRGTLSEGLADEITGAIAESDQQLVKFHGMYLQDDRDLRAERTRKKLEKAFAFMLRVRIPGGVLTTKQWRALDCVARVYGNGTMRATTRQTIQLHGVIKSNLKATLKAIDEQLLSTIAACGDVNRNVMCNPNPYQSKAHAIALELARGISDHLTPRTGAYREIWLEGARIAGEMEAVEPIYGRTYLPRKFKTVVGVPPSNDVDVFAHDLGFIAILDETGDVAGWNVTVGGGMGMSHGEPDTYPRTADLMGSCLTRDAIAVAEAVVTVQRDWGDRTNRKHARLKYTIEDRGLDAFRAEVEKRAGVTLEAPRPFTFTSTGDRYGWTEGENGDAHLTLYVENGRICTAAPLRIFGIDAPESSQLCVRPTGERWRCGQQASFALADRIGRAPVRREQRDVDWYGRVVAVCYKGAEDLNRWMVANGWAVAFRRYSLDYVAEETMARKDRIKIWSGDFDMPWEWRAQYRNR